MKARATASLAALKVVKVVLVAAMAATTSTAWAQYPGGAGSGNPGASSGRGAMGSGRANRDGAKSDQRGVGAEVTLATIVQHRLFELEEDLKLTSAQQALWSAYAGQVMKLLTDVSRAGVGVSVAGEHVSALQQFDRIADVARNRLAAIEDIADAGKALYAGLTPEQQALADRRLVLAVLPLSGGESLRSAARPAAPRGDPLNSMSETASKR